MTLNPNADQELILVKMRGALSQEVVEGVDDVQNMPRSAGGFIVPFFDVDFGPLIAITRGRTFNSEDAQPHETYFFVTAYAPSKRVVRIMLGNLVRGGFLIGWTPSVNCSTLIAGGGTEYQIYDEDRPTIYAQRQTFRFSVNLALQSA